jgi:two-component system sensor histidine kinase PilS (NtrC family)
MFLHDLREMEAQLRTEKLASMGRMSAAVAHEIRNPLAAITQANALLAEDLASQPGPQQLCRIVGRTPTVWPASPKKSSTWHACSRAQKPIRASRRRWTPCWPRSATNGVQAAPPRQLLLRLNATARHIPFDEEHLRRVLINLLDNAQRHRSHAGNEAGLQLISGYGP